MRQFWARLIYFRTRAAIFLFQKFFARATSGGVRNDGENPLLLLNICCCITLLLSKGLYKETLLLCIKVASGRFRRAETCCCDNIRTFTPNWSKLPRTSRSF